MGKIKIRCFKCHSKLDVTDIKAFSKINCPACKCELIVPKPFGNLLLEENIGEGDLATVYRSIDLTLDREIAIKALKKEFSKKSDTREAFIKKARAASAINHPNVIPIYSCGEMWICPTSSCSSCRKAACRA